MAIPADRAWHYIDLVVDGQFYLCGNGHQVYVDVVVSFTNAIVQAQRTYHDTYTHILAHLLYRLCGARSGSPQLLL